MPPNPCSIAKALTEEVQRLEKGLGFLQDDLISDLALALVIFLKSETCRLADLEEIFSQDALEIALLGFSWRMILPAAAREKSLAWEDAQLSYNKELRLKMPPIIKILVQVCAQSGRWEPEKALSKASPLLPKSPEQMKMLLTCISNLAPGQKISANGLRQAFLKANIDCNLDTMIAHLKSAGAISPKLSTLQTSSAHKSPLYEINPALFIS